MTITEIIENLKDLSRRYENAIHNYYGEAKVNMYRDEGEALNEAIERLSHITEAKMDIDMINLIEIGDILEAVFPDGTIEKGTVIKKDGRLALDEGQNNIHFLDGGFPEGTEFRFDCDADEEQLAIDELEGIDE